MSVVCRYVSTNDKIKPTAFTLVDINTTEELYFLLAFIHFINKLYIFNLQFYY